MDNTLSRALIEPWQSNFEATSPEVEVTQRQEDHKGSTSLLDETAFLHILVVKEGEPAYVPLPTNLELKFRRHILYFPMDFGELTLDGLIDTVTLQCNTRNRPQENTPIGPSIHNKRGPCSILPTNGRKWRPRNPTSTVELKFEVGDIEFHEIFIVMEKLSSPIFGLMFLQRNHTVLDMRQGILKFPYFSMQLKTADYKYSNVMEPILNPEDVTIPPNVLTVIPIQSQFYAENAVTGILQPSDLLNEEGDVTFCAAIVPLHDGTMRIHVNNFTD